MRVIAGTHRGRRLRGPQGFALRPTSDLVRAALFSILGERLPNSRFLDLYAGTGAVGVEALSRGATHVTCVESGMTALKLLRSNISDCAMADQITICAKTVEQFLRSADQWDGPYNIVFADPPYEAVQEFVSLFENVATDRLFAPDSWLVIEHAQKATLPPCLGRGTSTRRYRYGDTSLSLFSFSGTTPP